MNYVEIIRNVYNNGVPKQATRYDSSGNVIPVENGTIGTFCEIFRHDMSQGFPLTTIRKMPWKSIRIELEGFIKGITNKDWYKSRGCNFWNEWSNPEAWKPKALAYQEEQRKSHGDSTIILHQDTVKRFQYEENDLGPIYGYQWRNFGEHYNCEGRAEKDEDLFGVHSGTDQLKSIVDKLKTSPYDRRMVCSAWNPNQMHMQALPPCHWAFNVVVYGDKLNLIWHQRSCDLLLGVGSNIASYALLLLLLCKESGLKPGELVGTLADCHIYNNHLEAARMLCWRSEGQLPTVQIKRKQDGSFSIFDWEFTDVDIFDYNPQDPVTVGAVTV